MTKPIAFADLGPQSFPFTVEFVNATGAVVWKQTVTGPGVMEVPGQDALHEPVRVRLTFPDGSVVWDSSDAPVTKIAPTLKGAEGP